MVANRVLRRAGALAWRVLKIVLLVCLVLLAGMGMPIPIGRLFEADPPPPTGVAALVVKKKA